MKNLDKIDRSENQNLDFIRTKIKNELSSGKVTEIVTRFPPEPNGFLHIGHAKSICLNFGIAEEFEGKCNLRFDDTNPAKEEQKYIEAIQEDVRWLGFEWAGSPKYASDNFETLFEYACYLIRQNKAYVDDSTAEEIRLYRGTLTEPGKESPFRNRSPDENLFLFKKMRDGNYRDGEKVLRAKIDMSSGNINMRDPIIYRIKHIPHPRTGENWCLYPTYDFAHGQTDAIEGITHSLCTLEFSDHRPLYDWFLDNLPISSRPEQTEFSRLNLSHTVLSKRALNELVDTSRVDGWDDPRMPTIAGLRRRGIPPEAIRAFISELPISKNEGVVEQAMLDHTVRDLLNKTALRRMAVLKPLKIIIENYPEDQVEELEIPNHPGDPTKGTRLVPFGRELWIEKDDFMEDPPPKFYRLAPGREVRLRSGYLITCKEVIKNASGKITELRCDYDPRTRGGNASDGRKVRGTLHWVAAVTAERCEVRIYNPLFTTKLPGDTEELDNHLNSGSCKIINSCVMEPELRFLKPGDSAVQFERLGYFYLDPDSTVDYAIFNRTIALRDSWSKMAR